MYACPSRCRPKRSSMEVRPRALGGYRDHMTTPPSPPSPASGVAEAVEVLRAEGYGDSIEVSADGIWCEGCQQHHAVTGVIQALQPLIRSDPRGAGRQGIESLIGAKHGNGEFRSDRRTGRAKLHGPREITQRVHPVGSAGIFGRDDYPQNTVRVEHRLRRVKARR